MENQPLSFTISIVGDCNVGKTSFLQRLCFNFFPDSMYCQSQNVYDHTITLGDKTIFLDLWDEPFSSGREVPVSSSSSGVIFMYDISDEESFRSIHSWVHDVDDYSGLYGNLAAVLLVGNKSDLEVDRKVTTERAKSYCDVMMLDFVETSALTGYNVSHACLTLVRKLLQEDVTAKNSGSYFETPLASVKLQADRKGEKASSDHQKAHKKDSQGLRALMKKYQNQPTIKYKSLKCTFIGPPQVGKTTTRMRLMEEIVNISSSGHTASESTQLQKPLTIQMYEKSDIAPIVLTHLQWKKNDLLGEMQLLLHHIQKDQDISKQSTPMRQSRRSHEGSKLHAGPSFTSQPAGNASKAKQVLQKLQTKIMKVFTPTQTHHHSQLLSFDYVEKMTKEVLEERGLADIREMEETVTAYIMDFGGQPEFQEILPLVLRGPALHLVFFNASLCLKNPVHIKFRPQKGSEASCIEYDTSYTTGQVLFQLISSLYCLSNTLQSITLPSGQALSRFEPTAVLIGTHIDLGTSVNEVSDELKELLKCTEFWEHDFLRTPSKSTSVFYPLDNNHGTREEVEGLQNFIKELIVQRLTVTPLPRSWLLLHIALRHRYKDDGWCTLKQCVDLAAQCNISEEDVQPILRYIHNHIGNVLHYADVPGLSDIVFCEPNKLLEAINRVIILSFVGDHNHPNLAHEIRKTGEVPSELLIQLQTQAVGLSPITNKQVISLLKHFKIVSELPKGDKLFVPCLLQPDCSQVELASEDQLKHIYPQPLLIQFDGGCIPVSVFSGLVVELITQHEWTLKTVDRFRNHLTFICSHWSVELFGHPHFLEVRLVEMDEDSDSPSVHEYCNLVKKSLNSALGNVCSVYEHTKKTAFHLGLYCPCPPSTGSKLHFCKIISSTGMICSKTESRHSLGNGAVWFRKPNTKPGDALPSTISDKEMTGHNTFINCVIGGVAAAGGMIGRSSATYNVQSPSRIGDDAPPSHQTAITPDRSGSGETNADQPPSSHSLIGNDSLQQEALNPSHLHVIKRHLRGFTDWQGLGLEVGLDFPFLDSINCNHGGDVEKCKTAMLYSWLQTGNATKCSLVAALRFLGEDSIANDI